MRRIGHADCLVVAAVSLITPLQHWHKWSTDCRLRPFLPRPQPDALLHVCSVCATITPQVLPVENQCEMVAELEGQVMRCVRDQVGATCHVSCTTYDM